jgi:hypothetical protein
MRIFILGFLVLTACGPVPLPVAEQQCIEPARLAQRPRGSVSIGADSNGNIGTSLSIGISSDYIQGRDPDQVYTSCVQGRSGQYPSRPFSSLPEAHM